MDTQMARRMFDLVEPIGLVPFSADEPNQEQAALGFRTYWDGYFASRCAPLGRVPAEVVDALLYGFAPGEVAVGRGGVVDLTAGLVRARGAGPGAATDAWPGELRP